MGFLDVLKDFKDNIFSRNGKRTETSWDQQLGANMQTPRQNTKVKNPIASDTVPSDTSNAVPPATAVKSNTATLDGAASVKEEVRQPVQNTKQGQEESAEASHNTPADTLLCVLFDKAPVERRELEAAITRQLGANVIAYVDDSHPGMTQFRLQSQDMEFLCTCLPVPMPKSEVDIAEMSENPLLAIEDHYKLIRHKAFCMITQAGGGKSLAGKRAVCTFMSRLCSALLEIDGALGAVYPVAKLVIARDQYLMHSKAMQRERDNPDYFPAQLWVLVYPTRIGEASAIETRGLAEFGFSEIRIYSAPQDWVSVFEKIYLLSIYQITGHQHYKDGDVVYFTSSNPVEFRQVDKKLVIEHLSNTP